MDGTDPKASLVAAIVDVVAQRGPTDCLLSALTVGGENSADVVCSALDHAMDVLEALSVSSPRKSRKSMLELMESVEELAETVDADWCDGVSRCSSDRLAALASCLSSLRARLAAGNPASVVSSMLDTLRGCGDVSVQCAAVLSSGSESDADARMTSLLCVRQLPPSRLDSVCRAEASLFTMLLGHVGTKIWDPTRARRAGWLCACSDAATVWLWFRLPPHSR